VCAGLPLTRGFDPIGPGTFDPTTTKLVTWADNISGTVVVVDGHGPIEMQGQPGWNSFIDDRVFCESSVTFTQLDGPGISLGTLLFPSLWTVAYPFNAIEYPDDLAALPKSGAVTLSLCGQSVTMAYDLTVHALDGSVSNAVYVNKGDGEPPPFTSSAVVHQQLQSVTFTPNGNLPSVLDASQTMASSGGTAISEFTERPLSGLKDLLCWREVFNGTSADKWNVQEQQLGGANQTPALASGYTLSHRLEFNSENRLLLPEGSQRRPTWPYPVSLSFVCSGQPIDEALPSAGFWTAAAFRPTYLDFAPQTRIEYEVTGPTGTSAPYIKGNLVGIDRGNTANQDAGSGMLYSLSCNGVETLPPTQAPTRQQLFDATSGEGSYLVTVTPTGSYGYPSTAIPTNKDFFSFVIDRKKPVVGFAPLDDIFALGVVPNSVLTSTKPLAAPSCPDEESADGFLPRPLFFDGVNNFLKQDGVNATTLGATPGTYTLQAFSVSQCHDFSGNNPDQSFSQSWTVHAKHANHRPESQVGGHSYYGAVPAIEQPGLLTREYYRARLQSEKITSLKLTFDRPVDASTVDASQVTLRANGVPVGGCTIEQADATTRNWRINIPAGVQNSATFLMLEYDPSGDVMTADVFPEVHYPTKDDFPTDQQRMAELFRLVFISDNDNRRYSVSVNPATFAISYVEIAGNPLDWNGNPYDPEPSAIAARASWLMADTGGWPRMIDTSSVLRGFVVGRAASIGASSSINMQQNDLAIVSIGGIGIAAESSPGNRLTVGGTEVPPLVQPQQDFTDFGLVPTSVNYEGFIPRVPVTGATGPFSYWGLGTTIDPSPPALVAQCAAPSEQQWHSSAIACGTEITGFNVRVVSLDEYGNEVQPSPDDEGYIDGKIVFADRPPGDFNHVVHDLFFRTMRLAGSPAIAFGTTFQGYTLSQNVWSGSLDGDSTEVLAVPMSTVDAYFIEGESASSSPYWIQPSPLFLVQFETQQRTFGNSETTLEEAQEGLRFTVNDLVVTGETPLSKVVRSVTEARYSIEKIHGMLSACRQAKTFPGLQTTTLGPLVMTLSLRVCIKAETTYTDNMPQPGQYVRISGERPVVQFSDWVTEIIEATTSSPSGPIPVYFYYDAEEETWVMPPISVLAYCTLGTATDSRTIAERVANDYVITQTLTPDQETLLADGEEVTLGSSFKIRRN
jgi:hypothetical protein